MSHLNLLFDEPHSLCRVICRKGELRYLSSNRRGSLSALTRFAPPSKALPRLYLKLLSMIDFRMPGLIKTIGISRDFLSWSAKSLGISEDCVGIYVGEADERRKLVIIDVSGESGFVLKVAVGRDADAAIRQEAEGIQRALISGIWVMSVEGVQLGIPELRCVDPFCGCESIMIERIDGKQLTPEEFEKTFFGEESCYKEQVLGSTCKDTTVAEWIEQIPDADADDLKPLLAACLENNALELRSPVGLVHGDFAPWNVIRTAAVNGRQIAEIQGKPETKSQKLKTNCSLFAIDLEFSSSNSPLIFDYAYAAWCYSELLGRRIAGVDDRLWDQLVSLGALWQELRKRV